MGANRSAKQDRSHRKKKKRIKKSKKSKHRVREESRIINPVINRAQTTGKVPDLIRETLAHISREKIVQLLFQVKERADHCYDFDISFWLQKFLDLGGDVNLIEAAYLIVNAGHIYERKVDLLYELVRRSAESAREASETGEKKQQAPPKNRRKITRQAVSVHDRLFESEMLTKQFKQLPSERITELLSTACHKAPSHYFKKWADYKLWRQMHKKKMRGPVPYSTLCDDLFLHPAMWGLSCVEDFDYDDDLDTKRNYRMFTHHMEHRYNTIVPDINFLMHFKVKDYIEAEEDEIEMKRILDLPTPPSRQWPPFCRTSYSKELAKEAFNIDIGESAEDYVKKYVDLEDIVLEKQTYEIDSDLLRNATEAQKNSRCTITCRESAQQIIFEELKKIMMAKTLKKDASKENDLKSKDNTEKSRDGVVMNDAASQNDMLDKTPECGINNLVTLGTENMGDVGEHEYVDVIQVCEDQAEGAEPTVTESSELTTETETRKLSPEIETSKLAPETEQFTLVEVFDTPDQNSTKVNETVPGPLEVNTKPYELTPETETGKLDPETEQFTLVEVVDQPDESSTKGDETVLGPLEVITKPNELDMPSNAAPSSPSRVSERGGCTPLPTDDIVSRIAADLAKAMKSNSPVNLGQNSPKASTELRTSPTPNVIIESVQVLEPLNIELVKPLEPLNAEPVISLTAHNVESISDKAQLENVTSDKNLDNETEISNAFATATIIETFNDSITWVNKDASSIISDSIKNNIDDQIVIRVSIDEGIAFSDLDDLDKAMLSPVVELVDIFNPMKQELPVCKESKMIMRRDGFRNILGFDERYLTYQADFRLPLEYIYKKPEIQRNLLKLPENKLRRKVYFNLTSDFEIYMANRLKRKCSDKNDHGPTRMIKVFKLNDQNIKNVPITPPTTPNREDDFLGFDETELESFENMLSSTLDSESSFSRLLSSTTNRSISRDSGIGLSTTLDSQILNSTIPECDETLHQATATEGNKSQQETLADSANGTLKDSMQASVVEAQLTKEPIEKTVNENVEKGPEMIEILEHWDENGERPLPLYPDGLNATASDLHQSVSEKPNSNTDSPSQIILNNNIEEQSALDSTIAAGVSEDVVITGPDSNEIVCCEKKPTETLPSQSLSNAQVENPTYQSALDPNVTNANNSLPNSSNERSSIEIRNASLNDCDAGSNESQNQQENHKSLNKKSSVEESVDFEQNLYEKCANNDKIEKRVSEVNLMTERIQKWHRYLRPILAKSMERHHFDIFGIGTDIINTFPKDEIQTTCPPVISLENVMENRDPTFLSRYFLSMLQLANAGNVEIQVNQRSISKPTPLGDIRLKLLSRKRHSVATEDDIGAKLLPSRKRQHSASDDSDSLSESDVPLRELQSGSQREKCSPTSRKLLKHQSDIPPKILNGQPTSIHDRIQTNSNLPANRTSSPYTIPQKSPNVPRTMLNSSYSSSSPKAYHTNAKISATSSPMMNVSLHVQEEYENSVNKKYPTVSKNAIVSIYKNKVDSSGCSSQNISSNHLLNSSCINQEILSSTIIDSSRSFSRELPPFNTIRRFDKSNQSPPNYQERVDSLNDQNNMFASVESFNVPSTSYQSSLTQKSTSSSASVSQNLIRTQESMFGAKKPRLGNDDLDSGIFSEFSLTESNSMIRDS